MTHCAIVPFITVAHIHIKRFLTFSLILDNVLSYFFCSFTCPLSPLPTAQYCLQLAQHTRSVRPVPFICWSKMAPTVICFPPAGSGVLFSLNHLIPVERERDKGLNLNTVHFLFMDICLSFRNDFCIILIFFLVRESELTRHKPKNILLNYSRNGVFLISGSTDKASQKALQIRPRIHVTK